MAGTTPIRLGSANGSYLIFESNSDVSTSDSGIQSVNVKALWGDGSTVFTKIPAAGTSFATVFGHAYLPADFKVDRSKDGSIGVEYLDGRVARVTFNFKRPDPNATGPAASRQVFVDAILNYKTVLDSFFPAAVAAISGEAQGGHFGFPEPVVTVKYNSASPPVLPGGVGQALYAMPNDSRALGFPTLFEVVTPLTFIYPAGTTVYYNTTTNLLDPPNIVSTTFIVTTTFLYNFVFRPNPLGWQLTKIKYDPVAGATTYDCEEQWRNFYTFYGMVFVSKSPP